MNVKTQTNAVARQVLPRTQKLTASGVNEYEHGREVVHIDHNMVVAEVADFIVTYPDGKIEVVRPLEFAERFRDEKGDVIELDEATLLVKVSTQEQEYYAALKEVQDEKALQDAAALIAAAITEPKQE